MSEYVTKIEFEEYKQENNERFNSIEYELLKLNYSRIQTEEILRKVARRDFNYVDKAERDAMILAISVLGIMSIMQIANKFDLTENRVRQIISGR